MSNELQIFTSPTGVEVRVGTLRGEPAWVLADLCRAIGHSDPTAAARMLDDDEKGPIKVRTVGRDEQTLVGVTEAGVYTILIRSNLPLAKPIRRWLTHEVMPSLRKILRLQHQGETMSSLHTAAMSATMPATNRAPMQPDSVLAALAEAGWQDPQEQLEGSPPSTTNGVVGTRSALMAHADGACSCCQTGAGFALRRRSIKPLPTPRPTLRCSEVTVDTVDRD